MRYGSLAAIIRRRFWLAALLIGLPMVGTYLAARLITPRWRATAQVVLVQRAATVSASPQAAYVAPITETVGSQATMIQGHDMAVRAMAWLRAHGGARFAVSPEYLQKYTKVSAPAGGSVMAVSVVGRSRAQAEALDNALCQSFVAWKQELAQRNVRAALASLQLRSDRARADMAAADRAIETFKQSQQVVDVPVQQSAALDQLLKSQAQVTSLTEQLNSEQAHLNTVAQQLGTLNKAVEHGSGVRDDSLALKLQSQLSEALLERAAAGKRYTYAFPGVLPVLDARIQVLKSSLAQTLHGTVGNNLPSLQDQGALSGELRAAQDAVATGKAKLDAATKLRDQLKLQSRSLPGVEAEFSRLARSADTARALYLSLQGPMNELGAGLSLASGNVQIAQPAFAPMAPFTPNLREYLAISGGAGLLLALVTVALLERGDRRVRTLDTLRSLAPGPILGSVPLLSGAGSRSLGGGHPLPEVAEAYNMARANFALALKEGSWREPWNGQIVMVTSSVPGEGKSVTAAEMARSLARSGNRVVLIDADMRRPTQGRLFDISGPTGLAEVLEGFAGLEDALVATDAENLWVMPSGTPGRNPSELVTLPAMADVITALRGEADVVVLDTPPCTVVADALILAPQVDSIIFVVGAGQVDRDLLHDSTTALKTAAGKPVSFVLNRAPRERGRSYAGYYYSAAAALPAGGRPAPQQRPQIISQKPLLRLQSGEIESTKEVSP